MDFTEADNFCKNDIGGRLVLLKDSQYRSEFHNAVDDEGKFWNSQDSWIYLIIGGWIGISREEGSKAYTWSDGKTVFPTFNGFLAIGSSKRCAFYDKVIRETYKVEASWEDADCTE